MVNFILKVFTPGPLDQPVTEISEQLTAPALQDIAMEVRGESVRERLSPVDVVTAEHSVGMAMRDVVVVGYDLELNEPHVVIES